MQWRLGLVGGCALWLMGCSSSPPPTDVAQPDEKPAESLPMGGQKSAMTFFITSRGLGKGGDLGGLAGADAHCQALAAAEHAGDHTWRAYLSASPAAGQPAVNARDRIGDGPWYNGEALLVAANLVELHGAQSRVNKELAVTERLDPVNGVGDTPSRHAILTGTQPDGSAFAAGEDRTCANWTSSAAGQAQLGHHDRRGRSNGTESWNAAQVSGGCRQEDFEAAGGSGLFYCFAID